MSSKKLMIIEKFLTGLESLLALWTALSSSTAIVNHLSMGLWVPCRVQTQVTLLHKGIRFHIELEVLWPIS